MIMDDDEFKAYVARTINVLIEAIERLTKQLNELEADVMILAQGSNTNSDKKELDEGETNGSAL